MTRTCAPSRASRAAAGRFAWRPGSDPEPTRGRRADRRSPPRRGRGGQRALRSFALLALAGWLGLAGIDARAATPAATPAVAGRDSLPPPPASSLVAILCYHDIADGPSVPPYTVPADTLRAHIRRCKESGWVFLSLSELLSYRQRPSELPERVVVLTFDDGYRSFARKALPILQAERVKATLAIVSSFIDAPPPGLPPVMSWAEVRAAARTGLVEVISHSHALHRYEVANPFGDSGPSVTTRRYLLDERRYENRDEYEERIRVDLWASRQVLEGQLGHEVSVLAWPYGEHTAKARAVAAAEGFPITLALGGTAVTAADLRSGCLPRVMVFRDMAIGSDELSWLFPSRQPIRAALVNIDHVFSEDSRRFRVDVERTVERVKRIGATHVFLQACPDPAGDGFLDSAYFMNHQVPVRADVWSRVAYELSYAGLKVWVRAPSMNLSWEWQRHPEWRIPFRRERQPDGRTPPYYRVSPDLPDVRQAAIDFYTDLAVYLPIEGVLFDDDAAMLPGERLVGNPAADAAAKSEAIQELLVEIQAAVRAWRPNCKFGRSVAAATAAQEGIDPDHAQELDRVFVDHDLALVRAYARREGHTRDAKAWVKSLARRTARQWRTPSGRRAEPPPVMFAFQTYDWTTDTWIPAPELAELVASARREGIESLAVYPVSPAGEEMPDRLLEPAGAREPSSAAD